MIQKVDNLKKGDLIVVLGTFQDCIGIYIKHKVRDGLVVSVDFREFNRNYDSSIRTRHSTQQRVYKITEDNLTQPLLNSYKDILKNLGL